MGMDGLSIANTGVVKESTSADYANKTEQAMHSDAVNDSRQVQSLGVNQRVRPKDDDEGSTGQQQPQQQSPQEQNQEGVENDFNDGLVTETENNDEIADEADIEDIENPNKDFYVKLNVKDDIIELYDSTTNKLIETISGNELGELVQKLNMASGIFVNKKV